ncbi:helix-turn-helix domain-containing protein [Clostridium butyricum]|uniref:Transcriptional regulator, XRE family n=1 Tax=Clostridium butyricum E4 str. BoNT E BL5262 TaxID=632245 RepID=C4II67_CLOBU|nr:helix-turn-helix transcriptional regulator [Clostridium butyricum]EDT75826.1 HTH-type transcriptional regulator xre [Clostridium butyricum 5521]EEP54686.1 transcriptional regulator, XRE family [Clostridium butyricum E4 str. BoNT E BL5262]NFL33132.1 helix-turn-helix transcriptional regulator [Clostridium butyricum]NFS20291.1 helix-turn-helix transcriptional regulator [Clostridium butyricum]
MPSFGERLRQLRIEKNLTQEELANYFGLHKTRISQYELNKRQADDEMKKKLALYFNVSLDWLLGLTDIRNYTDDPNITIALHSNTDYDELPDEAKKEIDNFIEFVKQKYKK